MTVAKQWIVDRITDARDGFGTMPSHDDIYDVLTGRMCWYCEARPGDNEYCIGDGSPHPWVGSAA